MSIQPPAADLPALERLRRMIGDLRSPEGCPWDREQTLGQTRANLLEEAHEAAAALDAVLMPQGVGSSGAADLREELGDLVFQVAFICALAEPELGFDLEAVVHHAVEKMIERHPHVYGNETLATSKEVKEAWQRRKAATGERSILAGVPRTLPSLVAALRLGEKAAGVGFDWEQTEDVVAKVREELHELEHAPESQREEELGDILFAITSLARHLGVDPERALALCNEKFRRRFAYVEQELGARLAAAPDRTLRGEMERLWNQAKAHEPGAG